MPPSKYIAIALLIFASCLASYATLFSTSRPIDPTDFAFFGWSLVPYFPPSLWLVFKSRPALAAAWCVLPIGMDLMSYHSVFVDPKSSTAALIYIFAPLWNLLLLGPIGALVAWPFAKTYPAHEAGDELLKHPERLEQMLDPTDDA